jgi:uncharacterized protein (UPF0261 family)
MGYFRARREANVDKYILILGSLDTKGHEVDFLRRRILDEGAKPLVIDTGVLDGPTVAADVDRQTVATAGGSSIDALIRNRDKTRALVVMADGTSRILLDYFKRGELGGVLSIGGSRGTALGTRAMQALPVGVPKLMVSTIASGRNTFGPYVGTKDITLMHSVADIQGINAITRPIFTNAAAAIAGMSRVGAPLKRGDKRVLSASMLGVTTELISQIQELMASDNCEVIGFHAVGTGGQAMEELIECGLVEGVFDITPGEMTQLYVQGMYSAGPDRMRAGSRRGIPQVIAPGGIDFIVEGALENLPAKYRDRKIMSHTPSITLVRTSREEMAAVAELIADRLSESCGPVAVILPLKSFGWFSMEGQPLHDPQSDRAFIRTVKEKVSPSVNVIEIDTHLNDPQVGKMAAQLMRNMLK